MADCTDSSGCDSFVGEQSISVWSDQLPSHLRRRKMTSQKSGLSRSWEPGGTFRSLPRRLIQQKALYPLLDYWGGTAVADCYGTLAENLE